MIHVERFRWNVWSSSWCEFEHFEGEGNTEPVISTIADARILTGQQASLFLPDGGIKDGEATGRHLEMWLARTDFLHSHVVFMEGWVIGDGTWQARDGLRATDEPPAEYAHAERWRIAWA